MRRTIAVTVVTLSVLVMFSASLTPSVAAGYSAGVKAGDWWNYSITSNASRSLLLLGDSETVALDIAVKLLVGTSVYLGLTTHFKNGTTQESLVKIDVSDPISPLLIAANLTAGDPIGTGHPSLTETNTMIVGGEKRIVNRLNNSAPDFSTDIWWDQATGVMVEANQYWNISGWISVKMTSTSLWGLAPGVALILVGTGMAAAAAIAILVFAASVRHEKMR